ncbi:MAG: hypothetical protein J3K34DRAFT_470802, partial [Monoraphidium minutum]
MLGLSSNGLPAVQALIGHAGAAAAAAARGGVCSSSGSGGAPAGFATFALKNTPLRAGPGGRSSVSGATATVFGAT